MEDRVIASTCKECTVKCGSLIYVRGGQVVKIAGNPEHPHSEGAFCIKGVRAPLAAYDHPDRLLAPLRRTGERGTGAWQPVTWDEALAEIAARLGEVKQRSGPLSICGAVSNQYGSRGVAMALLLRSLGSPNYMINQDLCQGCRRTASTVTGLAAAPANELKRTRCVLVVGKSPSDSDVVQWMHLKAAKRHGARLIVVDPRRTQVARMAERWLAIKPGTDAALALAMTHVIFEEGLWDREFVDGWCTGTEELRRRAAQYPPAAAQSITGVSADEIAEAARVFATQKPACLVLGHGIDAQANGVATARAFYALLALTGNVDRPGTNRMAKGLAGFRDTGPILNDPAFRLPRAVEEQIIGGREFPLWSGPDAWAKTCHNPSVIRAMASGDPYPVRALYVSGVNIVCTYPDMRATIAALRGLDLLVVASDHMTPTAELADFVLPKTTLLEEEEISSEPNAPCLSVMQRVLPLRGEVRTDMEIAIALRDQLRARGLVDYDVLPWNSHREFTDYQLQDTGLDFDELRARGFHEFGFGYEGWRKRGFPTPSGKIELASSRLAAAGYDPLPDFTPANYHERDPAYPLTLLTGIRTMAYHHSRFRNHAWARSVQNVPELRISPATAERYGVAGGDWVALETPNGAGGVYLQAKVTEEMPADVVGTGMGWWFPEVRTPDRGALTYNVDAAISYGPPWDPVSGSPEARNCACRIRRVEPAELADLPRVNARAAPAPAGAEA